MKRVRQAGLTMVEIMVSLVLVAIACAFVFSIQVRMSSALRDQATVSEVQQTLRSASDLLTRDLRMAGYLAQSIGAANNLLGNAQSPIMVKNGGAGPDELTIMYADTSLVAVVSPTNGSDSFLNLLSLFTTTVTDPTGLRPTPVSGFSVGQTVLATQARPQYDATGTIITVPAGIGCVIGITGIIPPDKIVTSPLGSIWNLLANLQCTGLVSPLLGSILSILTVWNNGYMEFTKLVYKTYRIRDRTVDPRGVLQMCDWSTTTTFCAPNGPDWQDLALGIVDMQIALYVKLDTSQPPCAPDGDATHDWFSSSNMDALPNKSKVVQVSITLLAKSTKEVQGVSLTQTPDLTEGLPACNHVGDVSGTALPVASTSSPYYGDHVYRMYTQTVELRNAWAPN